MAKVYGKEFPELEKFLRSRMEYEARVAAEEGSVFELVWYVFFCRFVGLGIRNFQSIVSEKAVSQNQFLCSALSGRQTFFRDSNCQLFVAPRSCKELSLAEHVAAFGDEDLEPVDESIG